MNDNTPNNNVEEVPLDLFNQVSLEEYEPVEIVDLSTTPAAPQQEEEGPATVISVPIEAYEAAMAKVYSSDEPQSTN